MERILKNSKTLKKGQNPTKINKIMMARTQKKRIKS
jgi:hypothetical protein